MTYEEAVAAVAKERYCLPEELSVCSERGVANCHLDPCIRVAELMLEDPPRKQDAVDEFDNNEKAPGEEDGPWAEGWETRTGAKSSNPKTLMGNLKVPNLSVVPFTAIIHEARAMEYGAFHAPRKDGSKGYGPFNWRESGVEYMVYIEAALRHLASAADREDIDPDTGGMRVTHLGLAKATIGILIDAIEHGTVIDDRPKTARGRVAALLRELRRSA